MKTDREQMQLDRRLPEKVSFWAGVTEIRKKEGGVSIRVGFPEVLFGSVRHGSAAVGSIRYGNGSIRFSVVTLLKRP